MVKKPSIYTGCMTNNPFCLSSCKSSGLMMSEPQQLKIQWMAVVWAATLLAGNKWNKTGQTIEVPRSTGLIWGGISMHFPLSSLCCLCIIWAYRFSANTPPWTWALYSMRSNMTGLKNGWNKADKHLSEATKCLQIERSERIQAHNAK